MENPWLNITKNTESKPEDRIPTYYRSHPLLPEECYKTLEDLVLELAYDYDDLQKSKDIIKAFIDDDYDDFISFLVDEYDFYVTEARQVADALPNMKSKEELIDFLYDKGIWN